MNLCELCPRACGANRSLQQGECGCGDKIKIAKAMNHFGEEPPLVGDKGSGAVFFCGCPMNCVFCQNAAISDGQKGEIYSERQLINLLLSLSRRAENINLVTAGQWLVQLLPVLATVKPQIRVPVVYNSGGYEKVAALRALQPYVDVYLPDYKYYSASLAEKFSLRADYPVVAAAAIDEMVSQQPRPIIENGLIKRGVIIRHLVLPGCRHDSLEVVRDIARRWGDRVLISLMSQYTPHFNRSDYSQLNRRVTSFEYESVVNEAVRLGLKGFMQQKSSAIRDFTPDF